jgi:hypothetical protein
MKFYEILGYQPTVPKGICKNEHIHVHINWWFSHPSNKEDLSNLWTWK